MEIHENYKINGIDKKLSVIKIKYDAMAENLHKIISDMKTKRQEYDDFLKNATEEDIKGITSPLFDYKFDIQQSQLATEIIRQLEGINEIIDSI